MSTSSFLIVILLSILGGILAACTTKTDESANPSFAPITVSGCTASKFGYSATGKYVQWTTGPATWADVKVHLRDLDDKWAREQAVKAAADRVADEAVKQRARDAFYKLAAYAVESEWIAPSSACWGSDCTKRTTMKIPKELTESFTHIPHGYDGPMEYYHLKELLAAEGFDLDVHNLAGKYDAFVSWKIKRQ